MECIYLTSVVDPEKFPPETVGEIAFVGRSNVGKSTLLNAVAHQRGLARVSRTPGRTQMANFFTVPGRGLFVDLPGYGFAQDGAHLRNSWQALVDGYLRRDSIKLICFLIDSRREVLEEDIQLLNVLCQRHDVMVLLTKVDKLNRQERDQNIAAMVDALEVEEIPVVGIMHMSSLKGEGITTLRSAIIERLPPVKGYGKALSEANTAIPKAPKNKGPKKGPYKKVIGGTGAPAKKKKKKAAWRGGG